MQNIISFVHLLLSYLQVVLTPAELAVNFNASQQSSKPLLFTPFHAILLSHKKIAPDTHILVARSGFLCPEFASRVDAFSRHRPMHKSRLGLKITVLFSMRDFCLTHTIRAPQLFASNALSRKVNVFLCIRNCS
jgi:hypothetical protein